MSRLQKKFLLWDQSWLPLHWENMAFLWQQIRKEIIKAFKTNAVDTTGAGDSFWGGVLCSILSINKPVEKMEWEEIRKCAVLGNAVAGLCVQKRGGIPAIPTKEAVFEFMQK